MTDLDLFDYFPSKNNEYNQLLWVIAHDMHNFRILAKNERFRLGEKHMNIEISIKLLDTELILGNIAFNVYKEKYDELVKDIEKVLSLQTKNDDYTPSPRTKEYLKRCLMLIKGK